MPHQYGVHSGSSGEIRVRKGRLNLYLDIIRFIDISGIHHLSPDLLSFFLISHPNIKGLTLNPFPGAQFPYPNVSDPTNGLDLVFDCIGAMPKLENLSLGYISYDNQILPLNCLSNLTNLRSLELKVEY